MANGKTLSTEIDTKALSGLLDDLETFSRAALAMRKRLSQILPAQYGSDAWWEQSIERSKKDVAAGKYKSFDSANDFVRHLDSIAP
ncbi:MAG: hypothetical protein Q8L37_04050 [Candidatus Gottesmanbacteria bacterium]|nr:hypothetical protein [Candidatus Gottesmanbacteria bacterium]